MVRSRFKINLNKNFPCNYRENRLINNNKRIVIAFNFLLVEIKRFNFAKNRSCTTIKQVSIHLFKHLLDFKEIVRYNFT